MKHHNSRLTFTALVLGGALALAAGTVLAAGHEENTTGSGHEVGAVGEAVPGAGHGDHHGASFDPKTFGFQALNFAALVTIIVVFGGKAINKALAQRHETMKADLAEAARLRAAAETRLKQQEGRLANLETEVTRLRTNLKHEAEAEKGRLVAAAEEKVRRIQHETQFLLDQQVKEAELRFRSEVATAAARIAEELVRRQVTASDLSRLATSFAAEIERTDVGARPTPSPAAPPVAEAT